MEISQTQYLYIILYSLIIGFSLGIIYDIFRIRRIAFNTREIKNGSKRAFIEGIVIFFEDIAFSIFTGLALTVFIFHANEGKIRWFSIIFAAVGFFIYYFTLGKLVMMFSEFIIRCIRIFISFVVHRILIPCVLFLSFILLKMLHFIVYLLNKFAVLFDKITVKRYTKKQIRTYLKSASEGFGLK